MQKGKTIMFARVLTAKTKPGMMDELIHIIRDSVIPEVRHEVGFKGLLLLNERATGKGISYGIDRVEVTLAPGEPPRVLAVNGDRRAAAAWSVEALAPAPGYVGAVAMEGDWHRVACYSH